MYKSPIELITKPMYTEMINEQENYILQAIQEMGVNVDKEELLKALKYDRDQYNKGYEDAAKEFADKIDEIFLRYAFLHSHVDMARQDYIKAVDGTEIEMQSVWDVFTLKKYGIADYDEMNRLQTNIELIEKGRLLAELEKDFRLLVKETVGEQDV